MKKIYLIVIALLLTACQQQTVLPIGDDDLIYFIVTDRFYDGDENNNYHVDKTDSHSYHGGDFKGVIAKLDHIKALGATAIWLTPVQDNTAAGYHGYWIDDFYKIEPHLGTLQDLKDLVKQAHDKGIKVILDIVLNHTGYNSQLLTAHPDWFHAERTISDYADKKQVTEGWLAGLPDLDQSNLMAKKYIVDSALWLIEETGIDGFRLDTVKHIDLDFWREFSKTIKTTYPDFYLIGEVYDTNSSVLRYYKRTGIDAMLDYPLYDGIVNTFNRYGNATSLVKQIKSNWGDSTKQLNGVFVDNHDNKRFLTRVRNDNIAYLKQALTFMMTSKRIPILYYGTEAYLEGGDDPDNRRDMDWRNPIDSEFNTLWQKLLTVRENPVYKRGELSVLQAEEKLLVYQISDQTNRIIVAMNTSSDHSQLFQYTDSTANYHDVVAEQDTALINGQMIDIAPLQIVILVPQMR